MCKTEFEPDGKFVLCPRCKARYYRNQVTYKCEDCGALYHQSIYYGDADRKPRITKFGYCPECEVYNDDGCL